MNGLQRYNAIQKALSREKQEQGWKFKGARFQELASEIYQTTKGDPIKQVTDNIDILATTQVPSAAAPFFPEQFLDWNPYFNFDVDNRGPYGMWSGVASGVDNLHIKSRALLGDEVVPSKKFTYENYFAEFTEYCDANRGGWWVGSGEAPCWRFTPPKLDLSDGKYYTELEIDDFDAYGFTPGIGAEITHPTLQPLPDDEMLPLSEVRKRAASRREDIKITASEQKERLNELRRLSGKPSKGEPSGASAREREIKAETKLLKAQTAKLREESTLIKQYTDLYKDDIITKAELKEYLAQLRKT